MAKHINVTLEHHINRRYHVVHCGRGRRPAAVTYGKFNLRFRNPQRGNKRVRLTLDATDLNTALEARRAKPGRMLQIAADNYLAEVKAGPQKKTHQAYSVALRYFIEAVGNKSLDSITRRDLLDFRVYLREGRRQAARSEWNKFSNVMGFLKAHGIKASAPVEQGGPGVTAHDWPQLR